MKQVRVIQPEAEAVDLPPRRELPGKLAGLPLWRQVVVLSIWPLLEQVMNLLVGTVDLALSGHLEPQSTAVAATDALGVTIFVGWLMGIVNGSVGIGAGALVSRAVGGGRKAMAGAALGQAVLMAVCAGLLVCGLLFAGANAIGRVAGLHGQALAYCTIYLRIVMLAGPASALLFVGNACLRAAGDTRTPFIVMIVVNVVNLVMSVTFVYAPAPWGQHGVAGIAGGTFIAWLVGAGLIVIALVRGSDAVRLRRRRLRPHWHTMRRILRICVPNLLEILGGTWLATFIVLTIVGRLGDEGLIGAHMIAVRIESFSFQPGFALGIAAATLCGQYLGVGDAQRAKHAVRLCWFIAMAVMTLIGLLFIFMPRPLLGILTHSTVLLDEATRPLQICGFVQIFFATYIVLSQAMRGAGDTRTTMKLTYLSVFIVRVPGSWLLGYWMGWGLPGVWLALCADLTTRGLLFCWGFWRGGWAKVRV
ncbi:MAG: MATE family efflux transporter [Phycisphaeraceae bacterium]|nr:MATE family efflux transporter [Phycisphaeraceae bacterium]